VAIIAAYRSTGEIAVPGYESISEGKGSTGTAIVSNFIDVAAGGATALGSTLGISMTDDALVARNVISGGIAIDLVAVGGNPTPVLLNATTAGSVGAALDSSGNCLEVANSIGVHINAGGATVTPTTFIDNWWGAADGPRPGGSGASADAMITATPFLAAPSVYCGFDRIFAGVFEPVA